MRDPLLPAPYPDWKVQDAYFFINLLDLYFVVLLGSAKFNLLEITHFPELIKNIR